VDAETRSSLALIAEGVTELVGFDVAAISVQVDGELEVVAVSGSDDARHALLGSRTQIPLTLDLIRLADTSGGLSFVPHERAADYLSRHGWTPDYQPLDADGAWHPEDMLFAPFLDAAGAVQGLLAVDLPSDGMRPGPAIRRQLEKYAVQAGRSIFTALERARLAEHVRLASQARQAVREAARQLSLEHLLAACQEQLVEGFGAAGMWIHTHDGESDDVPRGAVFARGGTIEQAVPAEIVAIAEVGARKAWEARRVDIVTSTRVEGSECTPAEIELIREVNRRLGVESTLFVPLGVGRSCVGSMALGRGPDDPEWTENDVAVALDVGSDLGHAIAHAQAFEREQALVRELQELDTYKSELIATLSHELKTPLTSILGNLELLERTEAVDSDGLRSLSAIERGTHRLVRLVEDLMLLAQIGDPGNALERRPVDLVGLVADVLVMTSVVVRQRGLEVVFDHDAAPVLASGDAGELDRLVTNLVSNATKYTAVGGRIEITLTRDGDQVVLRCSDDGIGISPQDQRGLFREFFRSTNPRALVVPGTGLGLTIVDRIVARHGGRISVSSALGEGTTFEVVLPAARLAGPVATAPAEQLAARRA
jgi:signal transduction histidine kinase